MTTKSSAPTHAPANIALTDEGQIEMNRQIEAYEATRGVTYLYSYSLAEIDPFQCTLANDDGAPLPEYTCTLGENLESEIEATRRVLDTSAPAILAIWDDSGAPARIVRMATCDNLENLAIALAEGEHALGSDVTSAGARVVEFPNYQLLFA
jgi:hypothetical protein